MSKSLQAQTPLNGTQKTPHRRKAVSMLQMPEKVLAFGQLQPTHEPQILVLQTVPRIEFASVWYEHLRERLVRSWTAPIQIPNEVLGSRPPPELQMCSDQWITDNTFWIINNHQWVINDHPWIIDESLTSVDLDTGQVSPTLEDHRLPHTKGIETTTTYLSSQFYKPNNPQLTQLVSAGSLLYSPRS